MPASFKSFAILESVSATYVLFAGTPLEVQKRKACIPLLYVMTFLWICQIGFAGKSSFSCQHSLIMHTAQWITTGLLLSYSLLHTTALPTLQLSFLQLSFLEYSAKPVFAWHCCAAKPVGTTSCASVPRASVTHNAVLLQQPSCFPAACAQQACGCAVYGTAVVHRTYPACWSGSNARSVVHVAQGMIYSTWAFTALLM